ncbi:alpha/beta hydrolase [Plantactinospora sp. CA-294935]|uniref:alpha/beta hydrolase n=1 Tax=Plantactinospora sp. CA-294935 TaxID=3240012 RepID=UPI003D925DE3
MPVPVLSRRTMLTLAPLLAVATQVPAVARTADAGGAARRIRVIAERRVDSRLVDLTVESPAPAETATVRLLTPHGWHRRRSGQSWPTLYLLHGAGGHAAEWTEATDIAHSAELRHALVVMPDGGAVGLYSDWWNAGAGGPPQWETFHLDELRPLLERHYAAGVRRAVAGLSMGGFGALLYAARRPGLFRAAASYSGPVHLSHPHWTALWRRAFEESPWLLDLWGDPDAQRAIWQSHDPYHLARRLTRIPVYLAWGTGSPGPLDPAGTPVDRDEQSIDVANRSLAAQLGPMSARLTAHCYDGTHSWPYWQRELHRSLPLLLASLRTGDR